MREPLRVDLASGWVEVYDLSPAPIGWCRAVGVYDEDEDFACLLNTLRPVAIWATTSQGLIGLTPGEALEDALDTREDERVAYIAPDGTWMDGGDTYSGEEAFLASVVGSARTLRRLAEMRKQAKQNPKMPIVSRSGCG